MPPLAQQSFSLDRIMKRQVLKTILFALPKVLDLTTRRFPADRDRLKERNLAAWIGLMDESQQFVLALSDNLEVLGGVDDFTLIQLGRQELQGGSHILEVHAHVGPRMPAGARPNAPVPERHDAANVDDSRLWPGRKCWRTQSHERTAGRDRHEAADPRWSAFSLAQLSQKHSVPMIC
jgi:hypothetical protein